MCYSLWYNAPIAMPACRPALQCVHCTTSCNTQSSAPEDGRIQLPKHVELIGIINKPLLLHLVGVYINNIQFHSIQFGSNPVYLHEAPSTGQLQL